MDAPSVGRAPRTVAAALVAALACAAATTAALGGLAPARAHVGHVIARAERYLKLDASGNEVRLVVSLTLGAEEGERVLEAADVDGDGTVTAEESEAYLASWAEGLAEEVPVTVDGVRQRPRWGEGYMNPLAEVREVPVTLELVARLPLEGEGAVRFEDRMVRREVFDRTDVAFRARDGAELLASGMTLDGAPTDAVLDLSYGPRLREGQPIPFEARLRTPAAAGPAFPAWGRNLALGVLLLLLLGLATRSRGKLLSGEWLSPKQRREDSAVRTRSEREASPGDVDDG